MICAGREASASSPRERRCPGRLADLGPARHVLSARAEVSRLGPAGLIDEYSPLRTSGGIPGTDIVRVPSAGVSSARAEVFWGAGRDRGVSVRLSATYVDSGRGKGFRGSGSQPTSRACRFRASRGVPDLQQELVHL